MQLASGTVGVRVSNTIRALFTLLMTLFLSLVFSFSFFLSLGETDSHFLEIP